MVDSLKEFLDDYSMAVPNSSPLVVGITTTTATTQDMVTNLDFTIVSDSQDKKVELEYKGNLLESWYSNPGDTLDIELAGSQLIESSSTFQLRITGTGGYTFPELWFSDGKKISTKNVEYYPSTLHGNNVPLSSFSSLYGVQDTFSTQGSQDDGVYLASYSGAPAIVYVNGSIIKAYSPGGGILHTFTAFTSTNKYQIATDGTYLYGIAGGISTNQLERVHIVNDIKDNITISASIVGPGTIGMLHYRGGFLYSMDTASNTLVRKIDVTTGALTSLTVPNISGNGLASAIITTTHDTPKNYLVWLSLTDFVYLDLDTLEAVKVPGGLRATSQLLGQHATQIVQGVMYAARTPNDILIDFNGDTPTTLENPGIFTSTGTTDVVLIAPTPVPSDVDDMVYSAYSRGVHIDNS